jgi:hypothetical protein
MSNCEIHQVCHEQKSPCSGKTLSNLMRRNHARDQLKDHIRGRLASTTTKAGLATLASLNKMQHATIVHSGENLPGVM